MPRPTSGTSCYVTIGTGIGGACIVDGVVQHGMAHAEMGHQRIPHDLGRRSVPRLAARSTATAGRGWPAGRRWRPRWGRPAAELPDDHEAWPLEARYVAAGLANLTLVLSPERIVVGGGVGQRASLLAAVRVELADQLGGYVALPPLDRFLVPPGLGGRAGILGALALAARVDPRIASGGRRWRPSGRIRDHAVSKDVDEPLSEPSFDEPLCAP